ncbi:MAG: thioesterase family protein [Actinomycetes bacterium]
MSSPSATGSTAFAAATAVVPLGGGRWGVDIDPSWWIVMGPNGGYLAAVVLRAVLAEVDQPDRRTRSLTVHYLRRPAAGPAEVHVVVERRGGSMTSASAQLVQDGAVLALALVALGADRPGMLAFDDDPGLPARPDGAPVPPPEQVPVVPVDPERDIAMRRHFEIRWALGDTPFQPTGPAPAARSGGWLRLLEGDPVDDVVLAAMSDAWLPPVFSRTEQVVGVPTVDLTVHFRNRPEDPTDPCFVEFESPVAADGYLVEHGRILDRHGRLLAESRQLAAVLGTDGP